MNDNWSPRLGSWVNTNSFGKAYVVRVTHAGALVQLPEFGGLEIEVPTDELIPVSPIGATPERRTRDPDLPHFGEKAGSLRGDAEARKSIEALRFGLVPRRQIEELTLGFDHLYTWVQGRLPHAHGGHPQVSAIKGAFGTGKSHTMEVVRHVARSDRYVTARVEVDGQSVSLSNPQKLLHQLWMTASAHDLRSSTPMLDLYLKAVASGRPCPTVAPRGVDRVKNNCEVVATLKKTGQLEGVSARMDGLLSCSDEVTSASIAREIKRLPNVYLGMYYPRPMIGNQVYNRPYDFVEVLAGTAMIARLAGYRGLVITIDEFEVEQAFLTRLQYERVSDLLDVMTQYLLDELDYEPAPLALFFATVGDDDHDGDAIIDQMLDGSADSTYWLSPWPADQRLELARRLHNVYCIAYGIEQVFDSALVDRVETQLGRYGDDDSGLIRAFIKRYVAALDVTHGPPGTS